MNRGQDRWNNVYNDDSYNCRLINNGTSTSIPAQYTYWGTGPTMFCGPVDSTYSLGNSINTPAKAIFNPPDDWIFAVGSEGTRPDIRDLLRQLKSDVEDDSSNAVDAFHVLALYVGPGGAYQSLIAGGWERFLETMVNRSPSPRIRTIATAYRIQSKLDNGLFSDAVTMADATLATSPDDDLWFFCHTRKIFAAVGMGDILGAQSLLSDMRIRGMAIDSTSIRAMDDYLIIVSKSMNKNNGISGQFVVNNPQTPPKPKTFALDQCYPNPFNPTTTIDYALPEDARVLLKIYNVLGQEIVSLVDEFQSAGYRHATFNASTLPSGVYFYRLQAGKFVDTKKMILAK